MAKILLLKITLWLMHGYPFFILNISTQTLVYIYIYIIANTRQFQLILNVVEAFKNGMKTSFLAFSSKIIKSFTPLYIVFYKGLRVRVGFIILCSIIRHILVTRIVKYMKYISNNNTT